MSSNLTIIKNSAFLYFRLLITLGLGLFTTRIVLRALGVEDFGIYGVVAGLITIFSFLNAAMSSSTQRYLAFNLGRNDRLKLQQTFTTVLNIHLAVAVASFLIAKLSGTWIINHFLSIPPERIIAAHTAFQCTLVVFTLGIVQVPFHAAIIANERMNAFAYISIFEAILKLVAAYLLLSSPTDRLVFYAHLLAATAIITFALYFVYTKISFNETKYTRYFDKRYYQEVLSFSGWNLFGNIAAVARGQGTNILMNIFFGVTVNAAYGITMMIQSVLTSFSSSIHQAINPQIIKSYAHNNKKRTSQLMYLSSKYSFFVMLLLVVPFYMHVDEVLFLWLGDVPEYSSIFIKFILIYLLIEVLSNPLMTGLQATGKIKAYQAVVGTLILFNFPLIYSVYHLYAQPELAFVVFICISLVSLYIRLIFIKLQMNIDILQFCSQVLLKIVLVSLSIILCFYFAKYIKTTYFLSKIILDILFSTLYIFLTVFLVGMSKDERKFVLNFVSQKVFKK